MNRYEKQMLNLRDLIGRVNHARAALLANQEWTANAEYYHRLTIAITELGVVQMILEHLSDEILGVTE